METSNLPPTSTATYEPLGPPRYRGRKFLIGCLVAFVALVLLLVVLFIAFTAWLRTPSPALQAHRLVDAQSVFYADVRLRAEDPGVREFVRAALKRQQEKTEESAGHVPGPLQFVFDLGHNREPSDKEIDKILPVVLVWTRQADASGAAGPLLLGISLPRAGHTFQMLDSFAGIVARFRRSEAARETHRGEEIWRLGGRKEEMWGAVVGSDVLLARDREAIVSGIDRLSRPPGEGEEAVPPLVAARPSDAVFHLASAAGHADAAAEVLEAAVPAFGEAVRPLMKDAGAVTMWGCLKGTDLLEGELRIAEGAAAARPDASEYSGAITVPLKEGNVTFRVEPIAKAPGERHAFRLEIAGIEAAVRHGLNSFQNRSGRIHPEPGVPSPEPPEPPKPPESLPPPERPGP